jgi:hypothetical protein
VTNNSISGKKPQWGSQGASLRRKDGAQKEQIVNSWANLNNEEVLPFPGINSNLEQRVTH